MKWIKNLEVNLQEVLKSGLTAFILKVIGAGLSFAFNVAVARLLGAEGTGLYFLALSIATISSLLSRVGLDHALLRFVSGYAAHKEWGKVKSVYAFSIKFVIVSSIIVSLLLFVAAPYIATFIFNKADLAEPLRWMALSILPLSMLSLNAESLKGLKNIRDAMLVNGVGLPLMNLIIIYSLATQVVIVDVFWSYLIASTSVSIFGLWRWKVSMREYSSPKAAFNTQDLIESCKQLFGVSIVRSVVIQWGPLIFLGVWSSAVDTAIFGAAARLSGLLGFVLVSMNQIMAPKFAELFALDDMETLENIARKVVFGNFVLVSPFFVVCIFAGDLIMGLFGPEFSTSGDVLLVLAIGIFVSGLMGSVGNILIMSGNEKTFWHISILSAFILIVSCILFIPDFGVLGAAWAATLAIITNNLLAAYHARKKLNVQVLPIFRRIR